MYSTVFHLLKGIFLKAFIEALGKRSKRITKEQKRNERLVTRLLPPLVVEKLKENQVRIVVCKIQLCK